MIFTIFISFFILSFFINLLPLNKNTILRCKIHNTNFFSRIFLKICGIKIHFKNLDVKFKNVNLILANHLSYIDIVLLASITPVLFVTSVEIKEQPILGLFAKCGGSIFVERRQKMKIKKDLEQLDFYISQGFTLLLFPEGTTSNGKTLLPFKSSLFDAVINKNISILNLCIKYIALDGDLINENNKDNIYFYGDMTFWPHLIRFLNINRLDVAIDFAGFFNAKNFTSRKELTNHSYKLILEKY
jgi:1-acyl-sn-glycerol-3-phosphate acyltransferase